MPHTDCPCCYMHVTWLNLRWTQLHTVQCIIFCSSAVAWTHLGSIFLLPTSFMLSHFFFAGTRVDLFTSKQKWGQFPKNIGIQALKSPKKVINKIFLLIWYLQKDFQNDYANFQNKKVVMIKSPQVKVHIFWEGHKILRNLHCWFDWHYIGQINAGDFAKFCGLLRIYEL